MVEVREETISYRSDTARIKTSLRQICQGAISVEGGEEGGSYGRKSTTQLKTSLRKIRQGTLLVEAAEKDISYG